MTIKTMQPLLNIFFYLLLNKFNLITELNDNPRGEDNLLLYYLI